MKGRADYKHSNSGRTSSCYPLVMKINSEQQKTYCFANFSVEFSFIAFADHLNSELFVSY